MSLQIVQTSASEETILSNASIDYISNNTGNNHKNDDNEALDDDHSSYDDDMEEQANEDSVSKATEENRVDEMYENNELENSGKL